MGDVGLARLRTAVSQRQYPYVPGSEVSGEVLEVGSAVTTYCVGDRVFGAPLDGAFRTECLVEAERVHRIPDGVNPSVCAGFELNYGTAVRDPLRDYWIVFRTWTFCLRHVPCVTACE